MTFRSFSRLILLAACGACLLACSSTYVLPDSSTAALAHLDREGALAIVRRNIPATPSQRGFYADFFADGILRHSDGSIDTRSITLVGTRISYTGSLAVTGGTSVNGNVGNNTGSVTVAFRDQPVARSADLTKVLHVWVAVSKNSTSIVTLVVERHGLYNYWLHFDIAPENLDEFLTALRYLSPSADIEHHI